MRMISDYENWKRIKLLKNCLQEIFYVAVACC